MTVDFQHLIETGEYKESDLKPEQKAFLDGMKYVKDELIDSYAAMELDMDEADEDFTILEKIECEIGEKVLFHLKDWIECTCAEYIVCSVDNNFAEEKEGE